MIRCDQDRCKSPKKDKWYHGKFSVYYLLEYDMQSKLDCFANSI